MSRAKPVVMRMSAQTLFRPWDRNMEEKGAGLEQGQDNKRLEQGQDNKRLEQGQDNKRLEQGQENKRLEQGQVMKAQGREQQPSWGSKRSPDWDGLVDTVFREEVGGQPMNCRTQLAFHTK